MPISLQADATLPQGYILVDGQRVASVSTIGGLSATLAANTVTTNALVSGAVTTEKIAPGAVITADLADGAVTAAKMAGGQTGNAPVYGCRAWVNFNGALIMAAPEASPSSSTISVTAGNNFGFISDPNGTFIGNETFYIGARVRIPSINGISNATLGGVDVSTLGIQYTEIVSNTVIRFRFLSGQIPTSSQTQIGNGTTGAGGWTYQHTGIRESGNVSRLIKNNTGDYTVVFETPMPHRHYCVALSQGDGTSRNEIPWALGFTLGGYQQTVSVQTSSVRVYAMNYVGSRYDAYINNVAIFG